MAACLRGHDSQGQWPQMLPPPRLLHQVHRERVSVTVLRVVGFRGGVQYDTELQS
jgi:hypothetical protein